NLVDEAKASGLFTTHTVDTSNLNMPIAWQDNTFVPFDYGYFAFVYDTQALPNPPQSLDELINADPALKVIIQDPRSSTPGLGLMLWIKSVYGDQAPKAWAKLSDNILTTTKGWSEAYFNLFLAGEAPMVLSYSSSPAYHMAIEGTDRYQAAAFAEGHYLQVEVAAKLAHSEQQALADKFLEFMVSHDFQQHVPLTNVMYPVSTEVTMPEAYGKLIQPTKVLKMDDALVNAQRKAWVKEWLNAMIQ
ncbi:MAG: thiamine ABC transporter substrate binding subunit, partial [Gammaproteobacteria bacterium]|nr:thiamine ABC transporter substrate binding subunit [Gammaproteobacteria bacterium]